MALPELTIAKQSYCQLESRIKQKIKLNGGQISFADFMQESLYAPDLGYYNNPAYHKFGVQGDFITAPMLGSLLANCLANQFRNLFTELNLAQNNIIEIGAGNGQLAQQLINILDIDHYFILEISPELQHRQQQLLCNHKNIAWVDAVPKNFSGIILANEVLDALPVHLFTLNNHEFSEKVVTIHNNNFTLIDSQPSKYLLTKLNQLNIANKLNTYQSEICLLTPDFINSLTNNLQQGAILFIDYGFLEHEYYHPDRSMGTLMCYHNHRTTQNPLIFPGLQDISAHVNFSQIISHATQVNLEIAGFSSLANFLNDNGIHHILTKKIKPLAEPQKYKLYKELNTLISPAEMGEIFKVLLLTTK